MSDGRMSTGKMSNDEDQGRGCLLSPAAGRWLENCLHSARDDSTGMGRVWSGWQTEETEVGGRETVFRCFSRSVGWASGKRMHLTAAPRTDRRQCRHKPLPIRV